MSSDKFRLTEEQTKLAAQIIHRALHDAEHLSKLHGIDVHGVDMTKNGVCIYINHPLSQNAWRFHVEAFVPGQVYR